MATTTTTAKTIKSQWQYGHCDTRFVTLTVVLTFHKDTNRWLALVVWTRCTGTVTHAGTRTGIRIGIGIGIGIGVGVCRWGWCSKRHLLLLSSVVVAVVVVCRWWRHRIDLLTRVWCGCGLVLLTRLRLNVWLRLWLGRTSVILSIHRYLHHDGFAHLRLLRTSPRVGLAFVLERKLSSRWAAQWWSHFEGDETLRLRLWLHLWLGLSLRLRLCLLLLHHRIVRGGLACTYRAGP